MATTKKSYDKALIMRRAWKIFRSNNEVKTFSEALKQSWNIAKNGTPTVNFNQIYVEYYSKIFNFISSKIGGKREVAEEITQDTFLKVAEHLQKYDVYKAKISTWIYTIANNKIIDHYRSDKSSYMVGVDGFVNEEGEPTFELGDTSNADESVNSNDTMTAVNKALNGLREKDKQIATLYFIDQKQYVEIAEQLDMPLGTIKGLIYRIREKLQSKLANVYE